MASYEGSGSEYPTHQRRKKPGDARSLLPLLGVLMPGLNAAIPLVIWLLKRNQSVYLDHHAREALNFQILVLLMLVFFWVVLKLFLINLIFSMLVPIVVILTLMLMIRAGLKASGGHYYRYPFSVRLVA